MGWKDWFNRGKQAAAENKETVKDGIDKAGDVIDEKTEGQHAEHVDKGQDAAKDYVDGLPEA
jgi:hypothetical protein